MVRTGSRRRRTCHVCPGMLLKMLSSSKPRDVYNFRSRRSAEPIWGEFVFLAWRISGKLSANFNGEFRWRIFPRIYRPSSCFSRVSAPPPPKHLFHAPKFTPRIVGILLQLTFFEPKSSSRRFSACGRDQLGDCSRQRGPQ